MPGLVYAASGSNNFQFNSSGYLQTSDPVLDSAISNSALNVNTSYTETDISFTTTGASQVIAAQNIGRQYFYVQCPTGLTTGLWINKAGGNAGPNLTGCLFLAAGQSYETGFKAPTGQITAYGAAGTLCPAGIG